MTDLWAGIDPVGWKRLARVASALASATITVAVSF